MINTTQHTPGPWYAHCTYISGKTDNISIAQCSYRGKVDLIEAEANAHLIAAAPELLDSLQEALCYIEEMKDKLPDCDEWADVCVPWTGFYDRASKAVTKATGVETVYD